MDNDRARLTRLHRLEKVRALARQQAARDAAAAEGTLAQLSALADRTARIADDYRVRPFPADAQALRQTGQFVAGLAAIGAATRGDALRAQAVADARQAELAQAERRRAAVEERAAAEGRSLARRAERPILGARRTLGTPLE